MPQAGALFTSSGGTKTFTAATLADITGASSLGASGYQKLASGLIFQWGPMTGNNNGNGSTTFPTAFPSACAIVVATPNANLTNSSTSEACTVFSFTTTGFTWCNRYVANGGGAGGAGEGMNYLAVGY